MRFTRPGALPVQEELEGTELRGGVLGTRVEDERAGPKLRAGQVLQLVAGPIRWIELDVEVMVAISTTWWLLMHGHDVRQRAVEQPVVLLQQAFQVDGKRHGVFLIEVKQAAAMVGRREVKLVEPAGEGRHECDPSVVAKH